MAYSPTDQSNEFVESGMRLITSPSSDALMKKAKVKRDAVKSAIDDTELWDPTTGPVE